MTDVIEVASAIERVDVHRAQALVTRKVLVDGGGPGRLDVRLGGLPLALLDDSVRVSLASGAGARVTDLHLELTVAGRDAPLDTKAEEQLRELEQQRNEMAVGRAREVDRLHLLQSLSPAEYETTDLPDSLAFAARDQLPAWLDLLDDVGGREASCRGRIRALERELEQLDDRIRDARDALERESLAEAERLTSLHKAVRLQLEAGTGAGGQKLELRLSYMVPAARWLPVYELRVFDRNQRAELALAALVAQRTGEDWRAVELAFSTADLARSAEIPELESWRIGKAQPVRSTGWKRLDDTIEELFEEYDRGVRQLSAPPAPARRDLPAPAPLAGEVASAKLPVGALRNMLDEKIGKLAEARRDLAPPLSPQPLKEDEGLYDEDEYTPEADYAEMAADLDMEEAEAVMEPPPAPMASRSAPAPVMKKAANLPGSMAGAVRGRRSERMELQKAMPAMAPLAAEEPAPLPDRVDANRDALDYRNLRMQGPEDANVRGRLVARGAAEQLAEQLDRVVPGAAAAASRISIATDIGLGHLELPQHAVPVEESAGHFAVRYQKESPGEILSDGQLHAVPVLSRSGGVERVFRCVPALDSSVYQFARFDNPLGLPLLAGPVQVYREGDFVVTAPLDTTPPGKPITVNLGIEPGIRVARNTHFKESASGMFGGETVLEHRVELEVRSRLRVPARVELFERVPVSHQDDIQVEMVRSKPTAERYKQQDRGHLVEGGWKFSIELDPGQVERCVLEYRIGIPSKKVLEGGNRRD